jgi:hypothetical protein
MYLNRRENYFKISGGNTREVIAMIKAIKSIIEGIRIRHGIVLAYRKRDNFTDTAVIDKKTGKAIVHYIGANECETFEFLRGFNAGLAFSDMKGGERHV